MYPFPGKQKPEAFDESSRANDRPEDRIRYRTLRRRAAGQPNAPVMKHAREINIRQHIMPWLFPMVPNMTCASFRIDYLDDTTIRLLCQ